MLTILLCAVLSEYFQPGVIIQAKNSLMAQTERMYKESPATFMGQLLIGMFRVGTIAMATYLCCTDNGCFSISGFGVICGIVLAVLAIKMLCHVCLDYTFGISRRFGDPYEHYGNIVTLITILLYPAILILMRVDNIALNRWLIGGLGALFMLVWFYRSWRQFVSTPLAVPYMLVYTATLELLPITAIYLFSESTIAIL